MGARRRAVIDVGTNSVKLLVAEVSSASLTPLHEESRQTRLGQGFYETHRLLPEAIATTTRAVADFVALARTWQVEFVRLIATSAARDAINAAELVATIQQACGLHLEIISGEQEADWVYQGVVTDPELEGKPLLLVDVGGGSTEFILGEGGEKHFRESFRMGTVRLLETIPHGDPPTAPELKETRAWVRRFLADKIQPALAPALERELSRVPGGTLTLVGTGGTTTILARIERRLPTFDRDKIDGARIALDRVQWQTEFLWSLPLARREEIVGLPRKRADVILPGLVILEAVMEQFRFSELRISARGLRYAAVM